MEIIKAVFLSVSWRKWPGIAVQGKNISILGGLQVLATSLLIINHRANNKALLSPLCGWDFQTASRFSSPKAWR